MFTVGPTFFSSPAAPSGFDPGVLTPGTPVASTILASGTLAVCRINGTSALVVYQRPSGPFDLLAVVVTASGGVTSYGIPTVISPAAARVALSVRLLNAGTGEFVAFSRNATQIAANVIVVSGTTVTAPNTEVLSAALSSPNGGYGEVLSTTSAGVVFEATDLGVYKVHGIAMSIASGVITMGTAAVSTMSSLGGGGSRPVLDSGALVQFGRDVSGSPAYLAAVSFGISGTVCTPTALYMPTLVANRICVDSTYGTGGTIDAGGAVVALPYHDLVSGKVCSVRGAWAGTTASYSNSDSSKNTWPASPYAPPPVANVQSYGQVSPSSSYGTFCYVASGVVKMYPVGIFGTVNMTGNIVTLVGSGASGFRPGHVYLSDTEILYVYVISSGAILASGICGVG